METTIKINTDHLTVDILESIKQMFPHKLVEINIQSVDETDFILSNPAYANELKERIENYEKGQKVISLKAEEIL